MLRGGFTTRKGTFREAGLGGLQVSPNPSPRAAPPRRGKPLIVMVDAARGVAYGLHVIEVRETETFSQWLSGLRDARAKAEVARRVRRLAL